VDSPDDTAYKLLTCQFLASAFKFPTYAFNFLVFVLAFTRDDATQFPTQTFDLRVLTCEKGLDRLNFMLKIPVKRFYRRHFALVLLPQAVNLPLLIGSLSFA